MEVKEYCKNYDYKWHKPVVINTGEYNNLVLHENPSGCGSLILTGWVNKRCAIKFKAELQSIIDEIRHNAKTGKNFRGIACLDVGSITTLVGKSYFASKEFKVLKEVGFKVVAEYPNYRHCKDGTYKQKLLILKI